MRNSIALLLFAGCSPTTRLSQQAIDSQATFFHAGFGAGPALFTDATGAVVEEHRYEPFGVAIEAGAIDLNAMNKRTEPSTGWSDHGARWLAPEIARWLSTDPPVEGPKATFMTAPWALHPYQYVDSNPIAYWDPDGRQPAPTSDQDGDTPSDEIREGAEGFIPGLGQVDGFKVVLAPLRDDDVPVGLKIPYIIIAPPLLAYAGSQSELAHMGLGAFHLVKGTGRAVYHWASDVISPPKTTPSPAVTHDSDAETTMTSRSTAHDDPFVPDPPGPTPTLRVEAPAKPKLSAQPRPTRQECWTGGPPP